MVLVVASSYFAYSCCADTAFVVVVVVCMSERTRISWRTCCRRWIFNFQNKQQTLVLLLDIINNTTTTLFSDIITTVEAAIAGRWRPPIDRKSRPNIVLVTPSARWRWGACTARAAWPRARLLDDDGLLVHDVDHGCGWRRDVAQMRCSKIHYCTSRLADMKWRSHTWEWWPAGVVVGAVGVEPSHGWVGAGVRCSSRAWPSHCCLHCYYWTMRPRMRSLTCWSRNLMNSGSPLCSCWSKNRLNSKRLWNLQKN